jgi:hypothetical protein
MPQRVKVEATSQTRAGVPHHSTHTRALYRAVAVFRTTAAHRFTIAVGAPR